MLQLLTSISINYLHNNNSAIRCAVDAFRYLLIHSSGNWMLIQHNVLVFASQVICIGELHWTQTVLYVCCFITVICRWCWFYDEAAHHYCERDACDPNWGRSTYTRETKRSTMHHAVWVCICICTVDDYYDVYDKWRRAVALSALAKLMRKFKARCVDWECRRTLQQCTLERV